MKTSLLFLSLTLIASVGVGFVSVFAQDPASPPDYQALQRNYQDAITAFQAAQANRHAPLSNATSISSNPISSFPPLAATSSPRSNWRNFDPQAAKEINESNLAVDSLFKDLKDAESDDQKNDIKTKMKAELEKQYEVYLEQHEKPLKELEERLAVLRKEFDWRKSAQEDLVKLRLDTIWYNSQGLGWPDGGPMSPNLNLLPSFFGNPPFGNPPSTTDNFNRYLPGNNQNGPAQSNSNSPLGGFGQQGSGSNRTNSNNGPDGNQGSGRNENNNRSNSDDNSTLRSQR